MTHQTKQSTMKSPRHIVLCLDSSEGSQHALEYAKENVLRENDHVTLVGVAVPNYTPDVALVTDEAAGLAPNESEIQAAKIESQQKIEDMLSKNMARMQDGLNCTIETKVLPSEQGVGGTIVDFVNKEAPSQVVVGSRGLGPVKRTLMNLIGLGSVSDYIVHHSHAPVLIVRPGPRSLLCEPDENLLYVG